MNDRPMTGRNEWSESQTEWGRKAREKNEQNIKMQPLWNKLKRYFFCWTQNCFQALQQSINLGTLMNNESELHCRPFAAAHPAFFLLLFQSIQWRWLTQRINHFPVILLPFVFFIRLRAMNRMKCRFKVPSEFRTSHNAFSQNRINFRLKTRKFRVKLASTISSMSCRHKSPLD